MTIDYEDVEVTGDFDEYACDGVVRKKKIYYSRFKRELLRKGSLRKKKVKTKLKRELGLYTHVHSSSTHNS